MNKQNSEVNSGIVSDKIFDLFSGGRSYNAIWESSLTTYQKMLMLCISSQISFREPLKSKRYMSVRQIVAWTGISKSVVFENLRKLKDAGYIDIENRFNEQNKQQSNFYALTDKIFRDYLAICQDIPTEQKTEGHPGAGWVRVREPDTNLPHKELPQTLINTDVLIKEEGTRARAYDPSSFDDDCDESCINVEKSIKPVKEQYATRIEKTRIEHAREFSGSITRAHKQMIAIYSNNDWRTYGYVRNETIDDLTEETIDKYGVEDAQKIIKIMFDQAKKEKVLGKVKWDRNFIYQVMEKIYHERVKK